MAGLGWAATLGGLALCVLIFLSASVAFDDHGAGVKPGKDEVVLPPVPEADVPRVPLGRPARGRGGLAQLRVGQVVEDAGDTLGGTVDALTPPAPP